LKEAFHEWKLQQQDHILFFDEASRCNPGAAGMGGIIRHPVGNIILKFCRGLGTMTNNKEESFALYESTKMALHNKIHKVKICGDSMILIMVVINQNMARNNIYTSILFRIQAFLHQFERYILHHINRKLNSLADNQAKEGSTLKID
jgi:ribonuclease HI